MALGDADFRCTQGQTAETAEGGSSKQDGLFYLDRQTVDCGPDSVLSAFQLKRGCSSCQTIYYDYTCCTGSWVDSKSSYNATTQFQDGTMHYYLDRTKITCKDGYSLNKFHLQRGGSGSGQEFKYQYVYNCVKTKVQTAACQAFYTEYADYGDRLYFLDRLVANCATTKAGATSVMKEWYMSEKHGKDVAQWRYDYTCCPALLFRPSRQFDYATIQLQTKDQRCITWSAAKSQAGYYPVGVGDCGANSNNLWYAEPYMSNTGSSSMKLYPYPPVGDSAYYLQDQSQNAGSAAVGVSAPQTPGAPTGVVIDDGK